MPHTGCRTLADSFNRRFAHAKHITVGKTFVSEVIRHHRYEIQVLRKKIKQATPKPVPRNLVWGLDLTGKTDAPGKLHNLLSIVEHRSRAALCLEALDNKSSIAILRCLLNAVERCGKPKILKTDNEAVFTSWLFRLTLFLLGIRHQPIDLHCPWQNGRIERLTCRDALMPRAHGCAGAAFGTLKERLDRWAVDSIEQLNGALGQFQFWYNQVRPHQNLRGRIPAEAWTGVDVYAKRPK